MKKQNILLFLSQETAADAAFIFRLYPKTGKGYVACQFLLIWILWYYIFGRYI